MKLLDELRAEHERIERVLGAFRTWSRRLSRGEGATLEDGFRFLEFFAVYAGFHHDREEGVLFPALREIGLPERGPLTIIGGEHASMAAILAELRDELESEKPARPFIDALTTTYSHQLWAHIDAENSVLFPESEARLVRKGVRELPTRALTDAESAAAATGDDLAAKYPPMDSDLVRGEGCVFCPSYGETCHGIEGEWWNQWEWEELDDHIAAS